MATVVTAYYPLVGAKHSTESYMSWIRNFCVIPCQLVVYTDAASAPMIRAARGDRPLHLVVRPFDSFRMTSAQMMTQWNQQKSLDPEAAKHCPELYAVWALKQEVVRLTIAENPFASRWFIWCDIGIQRDPTKAAMYEGFPNINICNQYLVPGRLHFLEVQRIPDAFIFEWKKGKPLGSRVPTVTLGGGCIAGDAAAWTEFGEAYERCIAQMFQANQFAGKDQSVFFRIMMNRMCSPFRLFPARKARTVSGVDEWMSFPCMLAGSLPIEIDPRFE